MAREGRAAAGVLENRDVAREPEATRFYSAAVESDAGKTVGEKNPAIGSWFTAPSSTQVARSTEERDERRENQHRGFIDG
jgi:hypothetical protein